MAKKAILSYKDGVRNLDEEYYELNQLIDRKVHQLFYDQRKEDYPESEVEGEQKIFLQMEDEILLRYP